MSLKQDAAKIRILEAAKNCFARNGFDQTSVRQICEAADANLALVSYYYGSKEKLYFAVLEQWYAEAYPHFNFNEVIENPLAELNHFVRTFLRFRQEDKQFLMLLRHEISTDSPRKDFISQFITPTVEHLQRILLEGRQTQCFHFDSLEYTTSFIISVLVFPAYDSILIPITPQQASNMRNEEEYTIQFILNSLKAA